MYVHIHTHIYSVIGNGAATDMDIGGRTEVGISKRKQESKKTRKHAFDQAKKKKERKQALDQESD